MTGSGVIIRLIDVVLILLIGFVTIADFSEKTHMIMPEKWQQRLTDSAEELSLLNVFVTRDQGYHLITVDIYGRSEEFATVFGADTLAAIMGGAFQQNSKLTVEILPDSNATLQQTVDVVDICEQFGIAKNLEF